VWTWNAIGKQPGAWRLDPRSEEGRLGFLLNHLITDELPKPGSDPNYEAPGKPGSDPGFGGRISNSDPITGQAGWYDVRVRIRPAAADEPAETSPQFPAMERLPGTEAHRPNWLAYFAGAKK
jgi:hypothetical protein